jgi:hypothetical protein
MTTNDDNNNKKNNDDDSSSSSRSSRSRSSAKGWAGAILAILGIIIILVGTGMVIWAMINILFYVDNQREANEANVNNFYGFIIIVVGVIMLKVGLWLDKPPAPPRSPSPSPSSSPSPPHQ